MRPVLPLVLALSLVAACGGSSGARGAATEGSSAPAAETSASAGAPTSSDGADSVPDSAADGAPYLGPLTFAWKAGCDADVEERVTKGGKKAVLRYSLRVTDHADGLRVAFADMEVREVDGKTVPAAQRKRLVAGFRLPDFIVSRAGDVVDIDGFDEMLSDLVAADERYAALDAGVLRATLQDAIAAKYWGVWAGFWVGLGSIEQPTSSTVIPVSVEGVSVDADVVVESLSVGASGAGSHARLRAKQTMSGPALEQVLGKLFDQLGVSKTGDTGTLRRIVTFETVTDPGTMRPTETDLDIVVLATRDGETAGDQETRHATFTWSTSGC